MTTQHQMTPAERAAAVLEHLSSVQEHIWAATHELRCLSSEETENGNLELGARHALRELDRMATKAKHIAADFAADLRLSEALEGVTT